jgi:anti-sigma B factor antagonist
MPRQEASETGDSSGHGLGEVQVSDSPPGYPTAISLVESLVCFAQPVPRPVERGTLGQTEDHAMSESPVAHFTLKSTNGVTIVTFVNSKVVLDVREPLYELVEKEGHRRIILNFENVRFLSSAPIGVLIQFKNKAEAVGGTVRFCSVDPDILDVFRITSVDRLFDIHVSEADAIASF